MKNAKLWIILGVVFLFILYIGSMYNGLVRLDETVNSAAAEVDNQYTRRADLIPNLVATVKGYASHERSTLQAVVEARAKATQTKLDASTLTDPAKMAAFQQAQSGLSGALGKLMVVVERYPDLKANQNFRDLQAQLEGTENRIAVARKRFIETVKKYNVRVRSFPTAMLAGMFGFDKKANFEAREENRNVPDVDFSGSSVE